jgi:hypothetical protein
MGYVLKILLGCIKNMFSIFLGASSILNGATLITSPMNSFLGYALLLWYMTVGLVQV